MKKLIKKAIKLIGPSAAAAVALATPAAVLAATNVVPSNIAGIDNVLVIVRGVIRFILVLAFIVAFIMLLVGGVRWILAGGDEKAVSGARNTITAALIGLVIILVAYAIIRLVEVFFSANIISGDVSIPVFNQ